MNYGDDIEWVSRTTWSAADNDNIVAAQKYQGKTIIIQKTFQLFLCK